MQLAAYLSGSIGSFERDGLPLFRLTALEFPDDEWAWTVRDEYMLGDRILVAPVVAMGATSRDVTLPSGSWYPLLGGDAVSGTITVDAPTTEIPAFVPAGSLIVVYPDGIDTVIDAPQLPSATTLAGVGDDREVWLWPGIAADTARAAWHDTLGPAGEAQWTWTGRPASAGLPTAATWNGASVPVVLDAGSATIDVEGDGTLVVDGGGMLSITRGIASARVRVRLRGGSQ
jgi:hypothetical protein